LKETHKLADVKESDYDAVYPGGHGPLWDLADKNSIALIADFL
jgi:putative intracellular protease/amidase